MNIISGKTSCRNTLFISIFCKSSGSKFIFLSIILYSFLSCDYIDLRSTIASTPVNDRFNESKKLDDYPLPVLADKLNYNFLVISDTHYYKEDFGYFAKIEAKRLEYGIEFVIANGDLTQAGLPFQYDMIVSDMKKLKIPVYPVIGNHDIYNKGEIEFRKKLGKTTYSLGFGNTKLIFLDTANGVLGLEQKEWYEDTLKDNKKSNLFVFGHYNLFEDGFQSPTAPPYPEETYYFFDTNDNYDVDYFITGHIHEFYDKTIRNVDYIVVSSSAKISGSAILFKVRGNSIDYSTIDEILK